jgi:hypothetical protein
MRSIPLVLILSGWLALAGCTAGAQRGAGAASGAASGAVIGLLTNGDILGGAAVGAAAGAAGGATSGYIADQQRAQRSHAPAHSQTLQGVSIPPAAAWDADPSSLQANGHGERGACEVKRSHTFVGARAFTAPTGSALDHWGGTSHS